jgi:hypothetical protein
MPECDGEGLIDALHENLFLTVLKRKCRKTHQSISNLNLKWSEIHWCIVRTTPVVYNSVIPK